MNFPFVILGIPIHKHIRVLQYWYRSPRPGCSMNIKKLFCHLLNHIKSGKKNENMYILHFFPIKHDNVFFCTKHLKMCTNNVLVLNNARPRSLAV